MAFTGFLLGLTWLVAVWTAFTTSLIPGKYLGWGLLVSLIINILLIAVLWRQNIKKKLIIAAMVLALLGIIANVGIFIVSRTATALISSVTTTDSARYEDYAIVALKGSGVKLDGAGQSVVLLSAADSSDLRQAIATKTPAAITTADSPAAALVSLQDGSHQMAVYTAAYMQELQAGANNELFQKLDVLATFRVKTVSQQVVTDVTKPFVIYVSGIDTYGAVSTTSRSDVNILIAVNPTTNNVLLVNTPRDYYVQLNGTAGLKDKLTHAGLYGVNMSQNTLADLYNLDINYNIRINFTSLEKVVDAMGGVDVDSEYNFSSGGYSFVSGVNHLNGRQALAFSRERYSFEGGDRTRGQNQMKLLTAIINKMTQPAMALKAGQLVAALNSVFQTNMPSTDLTLLIRRQLDTLAKWKITSASVDGTGASLPTYSMGAQQLYVMIPDEASLNSARQLLRATLSN